jgi:hypothetical protein
MRVYAIGVDKNGLLVGGGEKIRRIQATKTRRKKRLRPLPDSARVGFSVTARTELQSLEGPLRRVFLFQVIGIPSVVTEGGA